MQSVEIFNIRFIFQGYSVYSVIQVYYIIFKIIREIRFGKKHFRQVVAFQR